MREVFGGATGPRIKKRINSTINLLNVYLAAEGKRGQISIIILTHSEHNDYDFLLVHSTSISQKGRQKPYISTRNDSSNASGRTTGADCPTTLFLFLVSLFLALTGWPAGRLVPPLYPHTAPRSPVRSPISSRCARVNPPLDERLTV
ncbi:hypothetical protein EVAR_78876_1 [Eumeta japonica]|uniref:Uncharacterized protein n=1 Tax=Eumeta variegata TaxID=151549 RepID=A0A4C1U2J3_EUMVA|nr:hypothetical protein EVAR_78876_1 [Eumeta japonica]